MKKLLAILFLLIGVSSVHAQEIYTKVEKLDKFNDVVWTKNVKTLVTRSKSTITFETKGEEPVDYFCWDIDDFNIHLGSRDSIVNLVDDVYGYETTLFTFPRDTLLKAYCEVHKADSLMMHDPSIDFNKRMKIYDIDVSLKLIDKLGEPTITFRTISKFSEIYSYDRSIAWIKFQDGSRLVYYR